MLIMKANVKSREEGIICFFALCKRTFYRFLFVYLGWLIETVLMFYEYLHCITVFMLSAYIDFLGR